MSINQISGNTTAYNVTNTGSSQTEGVGKAGSVGSGVTTSSGPLPPGGGGDALTSLLRAFTPPSDPGAALNRLEGPDGDARAKFEAALKDLLAAFKDPDLLSKLMLELGALTRQNALDARLSARDQARSELEAQAGQTREAAMKSLASAIVGTVIAVVSAAISIGGAMKGASQLKNSANAIKDGMQANKILDRSIEISDQAQQKLTNAANNASSMAKIAQGKAETISQLTSGLSGLTNALKGLVEGSLGAAAKMDEAKGQEFAAASQDSQANADMAKKFMDELEEMVRTAIQFIKELQQAEADMMATASRL